MDKNNKAKISLSRIEMEIIIDSLKDYTPNKQMSNPFAGIRDMEEWMIRVSDLYSKMQEANNLQMIKEYNLERKIVGQKENIVDVDGKIQKPSIEIKTLLDFLKKDKIDYFNFDNIQITINNSDLYKLVKFINKDYIFEIETNLTMIISNKK